MLSALKTRVLWFFVRQVESHIDTLITKRILLFYDNLVREGAIQPFHLRRVSDRGNSELYHQPHFPGSLVPIRVDPNVKNQPSVGLSQFW